MKSRRKGGQAGQVVQAVQAAKLGYQIGQQLGNQLGKRANRRQGMIRSNFETKIGPPPAHTRKQRKPDRNYGVSASIPGGLGTDQTLRTVFKDVITIGNVSPSGGTAGVASYAWNLGVASTSSGGTINGLFSSSWMPRAATVSTIYRQLRLNRLTVQFVPYASTSNSGAVAIGVDPDPSVVAPTTVGGVLRHKSSTLCDLTMKGQITYMPMQDSKKDPRYTLYQTGRTDDEMAFGVLQLYGQNTMASGGIIGYLAVTADITFIGPL